MKKPILSSASMFILLIFITISYFPALARAEIFKCIEKGKTVYTDEPCANAVKKITADPAPPAQYGYRAEQERAKNYLKKHPDINPLYKSAIEVNLVVPGMTEEQVRASMGEPTRMNLTQTKYGSRWQWIYTKNGRSKYVYLEDGVVVGTN